MKTLITQPHPELRKLVFSEEAINLLQTVSSVDWVPTGETYAGKPLDTIIGDYDIVLSGWRSPKLTQEVIANATKLIFIGHAAGTVVPFVDPCVFNKDIVVVNANKTLAAATAEGAFALILSAAWNIPHYFNNMKKGIWSDNDRETVMGLEGQTVGIIGLGEISIRLIQFMKPFHPNILLFSRYCSAEKAAELGVKLTDLNNLLQQSQIVSIHSTLTPKTQNMIGERELRLMKNGALLVNTARSPIINEEALIKTLKTGRIYGAFDVFNQEPVAKNYPLLKLPNVLCTPHMLGFSHYWKTRLGLTVIKDLLRWKKGQPLAGQVTKEMVLRQTPR